MQDDFAPREAPGLSVSVPLQVPEIFRAAAAYRGMVTGEYSDCYVISRNTFSEKGVRHLLAELRFMKSLAG